MANGRVDPYRNFNFRLEIDSITQGAFAECNAIGSNNDPIEYREGSDRPTVRKLPGLTKYSNIVLKWGVTDASKELFEWYSDITKGKIKRRNGSIVLTDLDGTEKVRWNFVQAWPAKYEAPSFNAEGTDVAIETLELAHEGVERAA
jgi:phage tail-like protein